MHDNASKLVHRPKEARLETVKAGWRCLNSYHSWRKPDCVGFHTDTQLSLSDTQLKHCESIYNSTDVSTSQ